MTIGTTYQNLAPKSYDIKNNLFYLNLAGILKISYTDIL